jgi:hypothetical protein
MTAFGSDPLVGVSALPWIVANTSVRVPGRMRGISALGAVFLATTDPGVPSRRGCCAAACTDITATQALVTARRRGDIRWSLPSCIGSTGVCLH